MQNKATNRKFFTSKNKFYGWLTEFTLALTRLLIFAFDLGFLSHAMRKGKVLFKNLKIYQI